MGMGRDRFLGSLYDRFVVTASADSPDAYGYCDFALGGFGIATPFKEGAKKVICEDWVNHEQGQWASLLSAGLISAAESNAWADEV
jgi:hypothetical protein